MHPKITLSDTQCPSPRFESSRQPTLSFLRALAKHPLVRKLSPVLRPVPDIEDFDDLIGVTIDRNEWRNDKLAGTFDLSRSASAGQRGELLDAVYNCLSHFSCGVGIILPYVLNSRFKLVGSFGRPRMRLTA
jgi:hypothetical protein